MIFGMELSMDAMFKDFCIELFVWRLVVPILGFS